MQTKVGKEITRTEIQEALKEFLSQGGHIEVLPSFEREVPQYVDTGKYDSYESVLNLLYSTNG